MPEVKKQRLTEYQKIIVRLKSVNIIMNKTVIHVIIICNFFF